MPASVPCFNKHTPYLHFCGILRLQAFHLRKKRKRRKEGKGKEVRRRRRKEEEVTTGIQLYMCV